MESAVNNNNHIIIAEHSTGTQTAFKWLPNENSIEYNRYVTLAKKKIKLLF